MTLLGMLMAALTGGLRLGARVWEKSSHSLDENSQVAVLSGFLKDRFEQALPIALTEPDSANQTIFQGRRQRLRMVSTMPISLGTSLFVIELEHVRGQTADRTGKLVLSWQPFEGEDRRAATSSERTLIENVVDMRLRYFGRKVGSAQPGWHDAWEHEARLPRLIEIDLRFQQHDRDAEMTLIAATMVDEWYDAAL